MTSDHARRPAARGGFSLIEIMVALTTGLILLNAAFALLTGTQKFIRRIEQTGARTDLMVGQMMWAMTGVRSDPHSDIELAAIVNGYPSFSSQGNGSIGIMQFQSSALIGMAARSYSNVQTEQILYTARIYIPVVR